MHRSVQSFHTGLYPGCAQGSVYNYFLVDFCTQGCRYVCKSLKGVYNCFHRVFIT